MRAIVLSRLMSANPLDEWALFHRFKEARVAQSTARRAFLRGRFVAAPAMRPFGALPDMAFEDACTRCGDCARACAEGIIVQDDEGFPIINPHRGECTFCQDCTAACETGALVADRPWPWRAGIGADCLSLKGVQCRACQDHCPTRAIRFRLKPGGRSEPQLELEDCTGCGACAAPCPVNAIDFSFNNPATEARPC